MTTYRNPFARVSSGRWLPLLLAVAVRGRRRSSSLVLLGVLVIFAFAAGGQSGTSIPAASRGDHAQKGSVTEQVFQGRVIGLADGDTLHILVHDRDLKIRLHDIDCPEHGQAYSQRATQAAAALVYGKEVEVRSRGSDRYGRMLAEVIIPGGQSLSRELVGQGWCWWYQHFAPDEQELERLQQEARLNQRGLWQDKHPEPPWDFRRRKRP